MSRFSNIYIPSADDLDTLRAGTEAAINRLINQLNTDKPTAPVNINQQRLVNVAWPSDPKDGVNVEYLKDQLGNLNIKRTAQGTFRGADFDIGVFGFGINSTISIGTDVVAHYIFPFNGAFTKVYGKARVAPTGADIKIKLKYNGTTDVLLTDFTIPAGSSSVEIATNFNVTNVVEAAFITADVIQVGSTIPGTDVVVKFKYKIT